MKDFRAGIEELNRKLESVQQLVMQLGEEEAKIQEIMCNCCAELKKEVEQKESKKRTLQDALEKL